MTESAHDGGTYNTGCRCSDCRVTHAERVRTRRKRRDPATYMGEHGNANVYINWNCRCLECTAAHAKRTGDDKKRKRQSRREGRRSDA